MTYYRRPNPITGWAELTDNAFGNCHHPTDDLAAIYTAFILPSLQDHLNIRRQKIVFCRTTDYFVERNVKRGLSYYVGDDFEISIPSLGAQKQVVGGGKYKQGIGFAIGFDQLMLC